MQEEVENRTLTLVQHLKPYISGQDLLKVLKRCTESSKKVAVF